MSAKKKGKPRATKGKVAETGARKLAAFVAAGPMLAALEDEIAALTCVRMQMGEPRAREILSCVEGALMHLRDRADGMALDEMLKACRRASLEADARHEESLRGTAALVKDGDHLVDPHEKRAAHLRNRARRPLTAVAALAIDLRRLIESERARRPSDMRERERTRAEMALARNVLRAIGSDLGVDVATVVPETIIHEKAEVFVVKALRAAGVTSAKNAFSHEDQAKRRGTPRG